MPKKKRHQRVREDGSPATEGNPVRYLPSSASLASGTVYHDNVIRNNFAIGEDVDPAECLKYLQEMFHGKLDPDVIHMVLTECEYNVNVALEGLFTLLTETPEVSPRLLVSPSREQTKAILSSSSSSESLAAENIITSEAEVHKSSEESERESVLGMETEGTSSALEKHDAENTAGKKLEPSSSKLANFVDAPPFVPSSLFGATNSALQVTLTPPVGHETSAPCVQLSGGDASKLSSSTPQCIRQNLCRNGPTEPKKEQERMRKLVESGKKVLVLLRGLPGSGKSTLAEEICGKGVVLSTDHFFVERGVYKFDKPRLPEAHEWNKRRAKRAMEEGRTPVIIDNTNVEAWEMMPYVAMALRKDYTVTVLEPDTPWKFNVQQLARRNIHGVQLRTLTSMLERYDRNVTAESLCESLGPKSQQPLPSRDGEDLHKDVVSLRDLSWRKTMENSEEQTTEKDGSEANQEGTISLQDLMVLTQNDSEESSNRSRVSSDSWSSGLECNDWEEVADDDFFWKTTAKASASAEKQRPAGATEAIREESEVSNSEEEEHHPNNFNGEPVVELCEKSEDEKVLLGALEKEWEDPVEKSEEAVPKPQRQVWDLRSTKNEPRPAETEEELRFAASWDGEDAETKVADGDPKPQREREFLKRSNSPARAEEVQKNGVQTEEPSRAELVTKSMENLSVSSFGKPLGTRSLENLRCSVGSADQDRPLRRAILGLDRATQDVSWRIPDFPHEQGSFESDEIFLPPKKEDASTDMAADDWILVRQVLAGKSDALPVLFASERPKDEECLPPPSKPPCNTLDQGTDTSDLLDPNLSTVERLELLQECVPEAPKPDLEDIFRHCHGDHAWAADLLLESGTVGDLKPLVIREENDEVADTPCVYETQVAGQAFTSQPAMMEYAACNSANGYQYEEADTRHWYGEANQPVDGFYQYEPYETGAEDDLERPFTLELPPSFVSQMVEAFGSGGLHVSTDALTREDLTVAIGNQVAREIHRLWMETLKQTLIREDKEMVEMSQPQENGVQHSTEEAPGPSDDRQDTVEDGIFPIDPQYGTKPLESMSFREIMEREAELERRRKEREKKCNLDMATRLKHQKLYSRFPGVDRQALDEIFAANNYSLLQSVSTINETLGLEPSAEDLYEHSESIIEDWVATESTLTTNEDAAWCPTVEGHEDMYERLQIFGDYDALRREATVHYHQRQQSFQKAKDAYHRGMKAVAAFYSQQGRLHGEKMQEANQRASAKLFDLRNARCDDNTLDLHGLHVKEAIQVLKNFVKLKKQEVRCLQKKIVLKIITGRGAHSAHNIPKLKFAVEGYFQSSQLSYDEVKSGMFHVKL